MRLLVLTAVALLSASSTASAAPFGFSDPVHVGTGRAVTDAAAIGSSGVGVVAWIDASGHVHAVRVAADGAVGRDRVLASAQADARDLHAVVTDRGEVVLVWTSFAHHRDTLGEIAASATGAWGSPHALAPVGAWTSAMPQLATLKGGTVAAIWRDIQYRGPRPARIRFARRAPGHLFGPGRSLGVDGAFAQVASTADGGALLSWQEGTVGHRTVVVARAARGTRLPGPAHGVAGRVRGAAPLFAGADGAAALSWETLTGRTTSLHTRAIAPRLGPVRDVQPQLNPYAPAQLALGPGGATVAAWYGYGGDGFEALAATAHDLGPWSTPIALHAGGTGEDGQPQPVVLDDGSALVAWPKSRDQVGGVGYDVAIGPAGAAPPAEPQTLGPTAGPGLVELVRGGERVIAAWPDPAAGVDIATRAATASPPA